MPRTRYGLVRGGFGLAVLLTTYCGADIPSVNAATQPATYPALVKPTARIPAPDWVKRASVYPPDSHIDESQLMALRKSLSRLGPIEPSRWDQIRRSYTRDVVAQACDQSMINGKHSTYGVDLVCVAAFDFLTHLDPPKAEQAQICEAAKSDG